MRLRGGNYLDRAAGLVALEKEAGESAHADSAGAARRDGFQVVDSREVTHYIVGKTGGDGIHYNSEASEAWARTIQEELDSKLLRSVET